MTDLRFGIKRLTADHVIKPFDCGVRDLNDFLFNDAKLYAEKLLAVTYVLEDEDKTLAYFSLSNDNVSSLKSDNASWRKIKSFFPHSKHRGDYPAVKVGRLAIHKDCQGKKLGTFLLKFVQIHYTSEKEFAGCCFITVDALKEAVGFYLRNGFKLLAKSQQDDERPTCAMYYNLTQLLP